ncbi:MAG: TPM domain-containing protein [Nanoarchaeota archaeon]
MKKLLIFFVSLIIFSFVVSSQTFPRPVDSFVNDFASVLTVDDSSYISSLFQDVYQKTGYELVFVSLQNTSPLTPVQYRTELFNYWGVGKEKDDSGLLILYSVDDNRIEVEVGYGLEGVLPDSKVGRMLDDYYVPYRDNGELSLGIATFSEVLHDELVLGVEPVKVNSDGGNNFKRIIFWIIVIIVLFIIISAVSRPKNYYHSRSSSLGTLIGFGLGSMARGGGGGFGGGFGGFGGGSSGGGGAGR